MATKESLKHLAYNTIKAKITSCEYAPDTWLNEEMLQDDLFISRTPIRDAISRLEQEGLVTIYPKKGIQVSSLSINDINMVFELRLLYEPYALLKYGQTIPYKTLMYYYEHFSDYENLKNENACYELDDAFHVDIINSVSNRYIQQSYSHIHAQNLRFRYLSGKASSMRLEQSSREHLLILAACLKKDWQKAAVEMENHLIHAKNASFDLILNKIHSNGDN